MKTIKLLFTFCLSLLLNYGHSQGIDSIRYHDGTMESQWFGSLEGDKFGCFVRFTPATYPDTLIGVGGYFVEATSNSTIKWKVYFDTASLDLGGVTPEYIGPLAIPNPAAGGPPNQTAYIYTDLRGSNIVVSKGDVYLGAVEDSGQFGMGIDTNGNTSINRQWQWEYIFSTDYWNTMNSEFAPGQLGITAYFSSLTTGIPSDVANSSYVYLGATDNMLHLMITKVTENPKVTITDVAGRVLFSQTLNKLNTSVNMNGFASGIYLVNIISGKGSSSHKVFKL